MNSFTTTELRQAWEECGFLMIPDAVADQELADLKTHLAESSRAALERQREQLGDLYEAAMEAPLDCLPLIAARSRSLAQVIRRALIMQAGYKPRQFLTQNAERNAVLKAVTGRDLTYQYSLISTNIPGGTDRYDGVTPWHQDFTAGGDLGVWIPLQDVTTDNGCIRVIPSVTEWMPHDILPEDPMDLKAIADDVLAGLPVFDLACPKGGLLMFNSYIPHATKPNTTDRSRWALVTWGV